MNDTPVKINLGAALSLTLAVLTILTLSGPAQAQVKLDLSNPTILADYVAQLAQRAQMEKDQAWQIAIEQAWAPKEEAGGVLHELMAIRDGRIFMNTTHNANAAISTATNLVRNTAPYNVNGAGETVGVWDGGGVYTAHQEFGGRVSIMDGAASHYHSTHVGGTIAASGVVSAAQGMAPNVSINSYDWTNDEAEMASRAMVTAGQVGKIQISNHSYGYTSGWSWSYSPPRWYGTWGNLESENFGIYSSDTREWDQLVYNAPYWLPFKAAGNDRNDVEPSAGGSFRYWNGSAWTLGTYNPAIHPRHDYFADNGYDTIPHRGNSKNVMTVGAVNDAVFAGARYLPYATMAGFSGWGPTDDGRIKPDIVANGVDLYSTDDDAVDDYRTLPGTSMSTPNASGSAILLVEYYQDLFPGQYMRASTIKGLIIHTADDLGRPGPDYSFGWGLMDTEAAAALIKFKDDNPALTVIEEDRLISVTNILDTYSVYSDGSTPLRATLCWTDPPGTSTTALDSTTIRLVNNLDLRLKGPGGTPTYYPYVLNPASPTTNATTGNNIRDNVEQVYLAAPPVGTYTIEVTYSGSLTDGQQYYSLIVSGAGAALPEISVSPLSFSELMFDYQDLTKTFTIYNTGSGALDYAIGDFCDGGKILWDQTHGVFSGYYPSPSAGNYQTLVNALLAKGYTLDTTTNLLAEDLDDYDVLVVSLGTAWTSVYTGAEVTAITSFVSGGGGLLVMGDNAGTPNANINPVSQAFGTTCGVSTLSTETVTDFDIHPTTAGISGVYIPFSGELTASSSYQIAWHSGGETLVTARTYSSGRVLVIGDINPWTDLNISSDDNRQFAENVFDWLNGCPWLRTSPTSGTVTAGNNRVVNLYFETFNMAPGVYNGTVVIANNDSNENPTNISVQLIVLPQANLDLDLSNFGADQTSIHVELIPDTTWSQTINIANSGDADLDYEMVDTETTGAPFFDRVWQDPVPVPESGSSLIQAEVHDPDGLGDISYVRVWLMRNPGDAAFMRDDGLGGDIVAGDGIYSVTMNYVTMYGPEAGLLFEALDASGNTGRASLAVFWDFSSITSTVQSAGVSYGVFGDEMDQPLPADPGDDPDELSGVAGLDPLGFYVVAQDDYIIDSSPTMVAVAASNYGNTLETDAIHESLTNMGLSYTDVTTVAEAEAAGAEVIIVYPGGYKIDFPDYNNLNDYVARGGGLIQVGDWVDWFPNEWESIGEGTSVTINIYDTTHPITQGLPGSWTGRGFFAYGYTGSDYVGWCTDNTLSNIGSVQGSGFSSHSRGISVDFLGFGRAVYIGFNVFGSVAGANEQTLLENALNWVAQPDCPWLDESPDTGTVLVANNNDITINFNTTGLTPGEYTAEIGISSNDPDENPTIIPVMLTVLPVPNITVAPPVIDITLPPNTNWSHTLRIDNDGFGGSTLFYQLTDIETTGGPFFEWVIQDPKPKPYGETHRLLAKVNDPDGLDDITSVHVWFTENPSYDAYMLDNGTGYDDVAGDGIFSVSSPPDSFTLGTEDGLLIEAIDASGNIGRASLEYHTTPPPSPSPAAASIPTDSEWSVDDDLTDDPPDIPIPTDDPPYNWITPGTGDRPSERIPPEVLNADAADIDCLVLSNNWFTETANDFLANMSGIIFTTWDADTTPTLAYLQGFDVVLLFEDGNFPNAPNVGDVVHDYVTNGGNLVMATFYWQERRASGSGWGNLELIDVFTSDTQGCEYDYGELAGTVVVHPVTEGVTSLWANSYRGGTSPKLDAVPLAHWDTPNFLGEPDPIVGTKVLSAGPRMTAISVYPGYGRFPGDYGGDYYLLFENALKWAGGATDCPWLDESPKSDAIAAGGYNTPSIDIDTTGLALGHYTAEIYIHSNDPDENPTIVPVQLTVAEPKFTGRVLFDQTHNPVSDFTGNYTAEGIFLNWANLLRSWGFTVDSANAIPNTYAALIDSYCTVVIPPSTTLYTNAEINALQNFVDQGKGLLILGEWNGFSQPTGIFPVSNALAAPFGMSFNDDTVYDEVHNDGSVIWPIIPNFNTTIVGSNVANIVEYAGCSVGAVNPAFPIAWADDTAYTSSMTTYNQQRLSGAGFGLDFGEPTEPAPGAEMIFNLLSGDASGKVPLGVGLNDDGPITGPLYIQSDIQYIEGYNVSGTIQDGTSYAATWFGIEFTPTVDYNLKKIELIAGEGTGTVTVQLRPDNAGVPSTTIYRETTYQQLDPVSWQAAEFDQAYRVSAGTKYWIVFEPINGSQASVAASGDLVTHAFGSDGINWSTSTLYWMIKFYEDVRPPVMAASYFGNGRVLTIGESNLFDYVDHDLDGITSLLEFDNEKLAVNIIEWLCEPQGIEVEKLIWDDSVPGWVNAKYVSLDEVVRFQSTITNIGNKDLDNIIATDTLPPMLAYYDNATVDGVLTDPTNPAPGVYQWDLTSRTLAPGESIVIEFDALVIALGSDVNTMLVEAEITETGRPVAYEDTAAVRTIQEPDLIITKIICDRDNNRIGYIVKNVGGTAVPAGHTTGLWIDAVLEGKDEVTVALAPGDTFEGYFDDYEWTFCQTLNDIMVMADAGDDVAEYDETNNQKVGGCISAVLEWTWNSTVNEPNYIQVMMAPVAADLNGDRIAEVIFSTFAASTGWQAGGILRAISGYDGSEVFSVTNPAYRVQAGAEPAVADIDNDGLPEIVVTKQTGQLICFEHDGTHKWTGTVVVGRLAVAIADLDQDGTPEIIASNRAFNNDGTLRWTGAAAGSYATTVADLNLDGRPEVVTGGAAYHFDGSLYWSSSPAGRPGIANFDGDPYPEIALVSNDTVTLKEHDGTIKWGPVNIPGRGFGPPVVADFDGDGRPEIGTAGRDYFVVYEHDGAIKWTVKIRDYSSRSTSSAAFDFDGDGRFEIVNSDERFHRILRGTDGAILFEVPGRSGTLIEQPIILDVDSDGRVEIVFAVNNYGNPAANTGIEVYGNDNCWPNAGNIWNQHTYHITNVNDDATVPPVEVNNWASYNNFRTQSSPPCNRCPDFNSDTLVLIFDLKVFSANWCWQATPGDMYNIADLNCDGTVNMRDFAVLGALWMGPCTIW